MRKLFSLLLVLTFLFNIGGYYLLFNVLKYDRQKEMAEEIAAGSKDEELILIVVPDNDNSGMAWIKPGKEFRYKDEMYDVVRIKTLTGKKYFYCINDTKEKQLIAGLNKTHDNKRESEKKLKSNYNYSLYLQPFNFSKYEYPILLNLPVVTFFYISNEIDIHSPPPKTAENPLNSTAVIPIS